MAIIVGYIDDSFKDGIQSFGAYFAPKEMWAKRFEPAWKAMLSAAPHPITEFKASNCRSQRREFANWTKAECDTLTKCAVDVIAETTDNDNFVGLGTAFQLPKIDYKAWPKGELDCRAVARYLEFQFAIKPILVHIIHAVRKIGSKGGDSIELYFDEQPGQKGYFRQYTKELADEFAQHVKCADPIFGNSRDFMPLQAADLLAYETMKEADNVGPPRKRDISKALARLVEARPHIGINLTVPFTSEMIYRIREALPYEDMAPPELYMSPHWK